MNRLMRAPLSATACVLLLGACAAPTAPTAPAEEAVRTTSQPVIAALPAAAILWGQVVAMMWDFFQKNSGAGGQSPVERRLTAIENLLQQTNAQLAIMRDAINDVGDAVARSQNQARLTQLAQVESELTGLREMLEAAAGHRPYPPPPEWEIAQKSIELAERLRLANNTFLWQWSTWAEGPGEEVRFRHDFAFPIYAVALAMRVTYLEMRYAPADVKRLFARELEGHAAFLRTRIGWTKGDPARPPSSIAEHVREGIMCGADYLGTSVYPDPDDICTYGISCHDRALGLDYKAGSIDIHGEAGLECDAHDVAGMTFEPDAEQASGIDAIEGMGEQLAAMASTGVMHGEPYTGQFARSPQPLYSVATEHPLYASIDAPNGRVPAPSTFFTSPTGPLPAEYQWLIDSDGSVRHVASGRCLDVDGGSVFAGAKVQLWSCHGGPNQRWAFVRAGGRGTLRNVGSNLCLTVKRTGGVSPFSRINNTLTQEACSGADAQAFTAVPPGWYPPVH